jgi:formylglycine-generating enzyme required for sulfatase activity
MNKTIKYLYCVYFVLIFFTGNLNSQSKTNTIEFVTIKGGSFLRGNYLGSDDEKPVKKIYIDAFQMSKFEVSNQIYCDYLNESRMMPDSVEKLIEIDEVGSAISYLNGYYFVKDSLQEIPVSMVTWYGADTFCKYYGYRLPTEAEWEYAAKGGKMPWFRRLFYQEHGHSEKDLIDGVAWYRGNSGGEPHKVGLKQPNSEGLFDMLGNLDEWCQDWYISGYYEISNEHNPQGPGQAQFKVIRGGSWYNSEEMQSATNRRALNPKNKKSTVGFRVVKDISD